MQPIEKSQSLTGQFIRSGRIIIQTILTAINMKKIVLFGCLLAITSITFAQRQMHVWKNGTATSFARTDVANTTFNSDIEDISSDLRKKYLVEKITWYDDETNHKEAYYEYDNNNRLERRIIHNTYFEQGRVKYDTIVDNYEYTGGNLTKISHKDVYVSYTYDLEYDNVGRLITSKYVNNIMHFCYRGGKMDSIWYDNDPECYTILKYDEHGNIVKEIDRVPEMDDIGYPTGNYVFRENEYEYDDKIRPFFNIDNAFVYDPIFGQGTTPPNHIRMLSTNNLIKYSRSSWHYTYNEEGLPIELRSRFEGVTPANDPKYVFTYRKIEKHQSSYKDQWCDTWNVLFHGWDPEGGDDPYMPYTFIYQLEEDTTINDLTYQRLTGRFSLSTMPSNKEYVAALRFAENKKVFVHYDNTEYLLYDFGAQVGDTLEIFGGINHYKDFKTLPHVITEIDTLDNGRLQIHSEVIIQFYEGTESEHERLYPKIWIEGIGSKDGIVQNSATNRIGSGVTALLCAYRDEDCIYTTDNPYYTPYGCVHNDPLFTATAEVNSHVPSAQKIMYNGQLLILHEGKTYNIMGAEIQ